VDVFQVCQGVTKLAAGVDAQAGGGHRRPQVGPSRPARPRITAHPALPPWPLRQVLHRVRRRRPAIATREIWTHVCLAFRSGEGVYRLSMAGTTVESCPPPRLRSQRRRAGRSGSQAEMVRCHHDDRCETARERRMTGRICGRLIG
jgi:hypothetical protein